MAERLLKVMEMPDGNSYIFNASKLDGNSYDDIVELINAATNGAVVLKGTLGTGGTITSLAAASSKNLGHAYKVITAGTYQSQAAKFGDLFICYKSGTSSYAWMLIPAGDDIEDTWRPIKVGSTTLTDGSTTFEVVAGDNIDLSFSGGKLTIGSSYSDTGATSVEVTGTGNAVTTASYSSSNRKLTLTKGNSFLPLSGGEMSGPITYPTASGNNKTSNYISAGGGYATGSGKQGLKILALDQSDATMGLGVDLTGGPYELTVATSRVSNSQASKIVFATHTVGTTAYKALATLSASGAENPVATFSVSGTAQAKGFEHSDLTAASGKTKNDYILLAGGGTKPLSDFQAAGNFLPISGGTLQGKLQLGRSTQSTITDKTGISIQDLRSITPTPDMFGGYVANFYFDDQLNGWDSILHMEGWHTNSGGYRAWELAGPASTYAGRLYFRCGGGTTWDNTDKYTNGWRTIAFTDEIPTVNNKTLTIQKNGTNVATFTANSTSDVTANITVPTNIGQLDSMGHYSTTSGLSGYYYKITIIPRESWMLAFTVRTYQAYEFVDYHISGYNYSATGNKYTWHDPSVFLIAGSDVGNKTVYFGHQNETQGTYRTMWVAIPAADYSGIDIINVTNGYTQVSKDGLFKIELINIGSDTSKLGGKLTSTVTAYRQAFVNEVPGTYSLPLAANGTRGGIQIGYTSDEDNRAVALNSTEQAYVSLPSRISKYKSTAENDPIYSGWYWYSNTSDASAVAAFGSYAQAATLVSAYSDIWAGQLGISYYSDQVGFRRKQGSDTWGDWIELAKKSDIPDIPDTSNFITATKNASVNVAGTSKKTYTYDKTAIYAPNGLITGGSALSAGLVTRGICGVSTPTATGACTKDNLYLNYDGNNTWNANGRGIVINAGSAGTDLGNGMYSYCAVRGDIVKAWVEAKGYLSSHQSIKTLKTNNTTAQSTSASEAIAGSGTINLHKVSKTGSYNDLLNKPTIPTVTNYYWANVKISSSSNTTTVPTFAYIRINDDSKVYTGANTWGTADVDTYYYSRGIKASNYTYSFPRRSGYFIVNQSPNDSNVAIGARATVTNGTTTSYYDAVASGTQSIAIGAGCEATGRYSVAMGYLSKASNTYSMAFGRGVVNSTSGRAQFGTTSYKISLYSAGHSTYSDIRNKTDVEVIDSALDFINDLTPITYRWNPRSRYAPEEVENFDSFERPSDEQHLQNDRAVRNRELVEKYGGSSKYYDIEEHQKGTLKDKERQAGLSAQDIYDKLQKHYGTEEYANILSYGINENATLIDVNKASTPEGCTIETELSVNYEMIIPFLIRAIQEQQQQIDALKEEIRNEKSST